MVSKVGILEAIRGILKANDVPFKSVEPGDRLKEDLALDSLNFLLVVSELEDRYKVELEESISSGRAETVGDVIEIVHSRLIAEGKAS